jgi:hypothetical protein
LCEGLDKGEILSLFDPIKGRGPKILELAGQRTVGPAISPDGRHIAFILPGIPQNRIRMITLHGATEEEIIVSEALKLVSLDWSADGTGFFSGDIQPDGARLLHIQHDGKLQIMLTQTANTPIWGIQSPNSQHLAIFKTRINANVWIVEKP